MANPTETLEDLRARVQKAAGESVLLRLLFLGFLVLVLQIPIAHIEGTIRERQQTREGAVAEVTGTWGGQQTLAGPFLAVPYVQRWVHADKSEGSAVRVAYFLPERLVVSGSVVTERRHRGIFDVPVYLATLSISGELREPAADAFPVPQDDVFWDRAALVVGLSPKGLQEPVILSWDDARLPLEPGRDQAAFLPAGVHVPRIPLQKRAQAAHTFSFTVKLGGAGELFFLPFGRETAVDLRAAWPDPGFTGAWLPESREVSSAGFAAKWLVPHLGRNFPQAWTNAEHGWATLAASSFGVAFKSPTDAYTATTRAVKYELLFVGLTFLVFFLFELFHGKRLHAVQYLLVGFTLCLFYLLLLALSEHTVFVAAYFAASSAVVAVVGGYCTAILGRARLGALVASGTAALYVFLFVLLQLEDYALLAATLGLFAMLAGVMYVTRKVDWRRMAPPAQVEQRLPVG
jgi:inner membrane protein